MSSKFSYGLAIFASAFLLFQVQPILGKIILPWFGGSAGVWVVCLLFFQAVLLLGYLYAHLLTGKCPARHQGRIHATLLLASLLALPILPRNALKPLAFADPTWQILGVLAVAVGLPYFLLSATSPLLQAWYARQGADAAPYRFYAVSNVGSMLALVSYPVVMEPWFGTSRQAVGWSWAYAAVAVLCAGVALASCRHNPVSTQAIADAPAPGWKLQFLWVSLAACGSALLLATTRHITQNVAAVPLLWVIPLALYLLTFILCFGSRAWYPRTFYLRLLCVVLGSMAYALDPSFAGLPLRVSIPFYCASLFVACMFCHGELVRLKPHPVHLTSFYLMCSLGGAVGASFVALVAPRVFSGNYELRIALGCCALLVLVVHRRDPQSTFYRARWQPAWLLMITLALVVIISLGVTAREEARSARLMVRNFYGVLRVIDEVGPGVVMVKAGAPEALDGDLRYEKLMNGTIDHGLQFLSPAHRDDPTTYYSRGSGIGITLTAVAGAAPLNIGVIGLGVGTLAAYGRPGDRYKFYEIDPLVVQLADQRFSFLRDSKAAIEVVMGDARLSLEQEPPQGFDVLVVDAFTGDAIPVHLLTREAFVLYFRHLKPGGVLAVHISNQHLNLAPVVAGAAMALGKEAVMLKNEPDGRRGISGATWVMAGFPQGFLGQSEAEKGGRILTAASPRILWTDDYSSLLKILK